MKRLLKAASAAAVLCLMTTAAWAQQKFGHINTQELFQLMPEVKTANEAFEAFRKTKLGELEQMDAEAQKKIAEFQEKQKTRSEGNRVTVDAELEAIASSIQNIRERIGQVEQKAQQQLQQKQQELYTPIQAKVDNTIKAVAKDKGYTYVFDTADPMVKYFEGGDDLMADVKTRLGIK